MNTVRVLAELTGRVKTTAEFWAAVVEALRGDALDFPYVLCYTGVQNPLNFDSSSDSSDTRSETARSDNSSSFSRSPVTQLTLAGTIGIQPGHPRGSPQIATITNTTPTIDAHWPFSVACATSAPLRAQNPCPEEFEARGWKDPAGDAIIIPLSTSDGSLTGLVVFGLNTRRPVSSHMHSFRHPSLHTHSMTTTISVFTTPLSAT